VHKFDYKRTMHELKNSSATDDSQMEGDDSQQEEMTVE
jgi:hypothetical protein